MRTVNRRRFMVGCSAAIAAMAGARLSHIAFGSPELEPFQDILLIIFLRGGMDGLNVVPIIAGPDRGIYEANRAEIAIPTSGNNAAINLDDQFGLHAGMAPLYELYQDGKFAIIHGAGMKSGTRSHFDAMQYMELGTPDQKSSHTGWLIRYLNTAGNLGEGVIMPALSVGNQQPTSLAGSGEAIGMTSPKDFAFGGHGKYEDWQRLAMRSIYTGDSWLHQSGLQTLDAIDLLEFSDPGDYRPSRSKFQVLRENSG
ncbi:twin-arginine translocation signal domain-containing protein [Chloroflexi bacterium TSY]|nr:twin-arginine translocation signal domain-containing protein [Chloroflexi bacterium TSY]